MTLIIAFSNFEFFFFSFSERIYAGLFQRKT